MTTGCGILLLVDEDVIVEAENTETMLAIKWIRSNSEITIPPKRVQSPPKNTKSRRCRYLTLYSVKKNYVLRILEN